MGTYLLCTIYDVIAPFLLEMGKKCSDIENNQHEIFLRFCLFRDLSSVKFTDFTAY